METLEGEKNTKKIHTLNRIFFSLAINLFCIVLILTLFFAFREKVQDYLIIVIIFIASCIFLSLLMLAKGAIITERQKISNTKELIKICLQSKGFVRIAFFLFWLIFFVMLLFWLPIIEYSDSTAVTSVIYGGFISFLSSITIVFIAMMLSARKVKKKIVTVIMFLVVSIIFIWLWILLSSNIIAIFVYKL